MSALPNGSYSVTIEMSGFKTHTQRGLALATGQTVQQAFTLEIGGMEEKVTVEAVSPLVETAASSQADSLGVQEVRDCR